MLQLQMPMTEITKKVDSEDSTYNLFTVDEYLKDLNMLISIDTKDLDDMKLRNINREEALLRKYKLIVPNRLNGINKNKLTIYLEDEIAEQVKTVIKKVFHYLFAGIKETYGYVQNEIDKYETISRRLNSLKKSIDSKSDFNKEAFGNKVATVWASDIFINKVDAIKKVILGFSTFDKASTAFTDKFNEQLAILKYEIKDSKIVTLEAEDITKDRIEDLKWSKDILLDNMKKVVDMLNDRTVFDTVIRKMKEIEKETKEIENTQDHKDEKEIQAKLESIRTEYNFIVKLKDIILVTIYKLALQLVILGNNALAAK